MRGKGGDRMPQHRATAERQILFGDRAAKARAASARQHDRVHRTHGGKLNQPQKSRQRPSSALAYRHLRLDSRARALFPAMAQFEFWLWLERGHSTVVTRATALRRERPLREEASIVGITRTVVATCAEFSKILATRIKYLLYNRF
jgi:hypothetical protein